MPAPEDRLQTTLPLAPEIVAENCNVPPRLTEFDDELIEIVGVTGSGVDTLVPPPHPHASARIARVPQSHPQPLERKKTKKILRCTIYSN